MPERWQGLLLLAKPSGPTSHDMVASVRRTTGQRRAGHAGTLDPLASGLLPMALGKATRLLRFLPGSPKVYRGTLQLGVSTDTDDVTGEIRHRHTGPIPSEEEIAEAARRLEGSYAQTPPSYSARKVAGQRMYRLARRGIEVEADPRPVEVARFRLEPTPAADRWSFVTEVSAGTYVRSLVRDLGAGLGCGATLASLERTRIGPMRLEDASPPTDDPERLQRALISPERMPLIPLPFPLEDSERCRRFTRGAAVEVPDSGQADGVVSVRDGSGELLGIGECRSGSLRPVVVLTPPRREDGSGA